MSIEEQLHRESELEELRRALRAAHDANTRYRLKSDELKQALADAAEKAILAQGPLKPVPAPKLKRKPGRAEVALLHCTDWQASKVTPTYNTAVLGQRIELLKRKVTRLVEIQRADHPVDECVLMFGGDLLEGLFNYPAQLWQIDASLFDQWAGTAKLAGDLTRHLLGLFNHVTVVAEWGNHGRLGSKRAEVPKNDNADRMVYEHARMMLRDEPRLTWTDCPDDVQQVEIGNYRALLIHGDEIGRGGFASPMTIVRHADRWASGAWPWPFRDVYLGHYHTHSSWAMANGTGTVYQTGSTESDNRYARDTMAASAVPSQRLHFIDPDKGRVTAEYKVYVDA